MQEVLHQLAFPTKLASLQSYSAIIYDRSDADVANLEDVPYPKERASGRINRLHHQFLDRQEAKIGKCRLRGKPDRDIDNPDELSSSDESRDGQSASEGSLDSSSDDANHLGKSRKNRRKWKSKPSKLTLKTLEPRKHGLTSYLQTVPEFHRLC